jgi:selenocysteine-specific elongation factor
VGVHHAEIQRGQELAAAGYLEATRVLSVEVAGLNEAVRPLRHRGRYKVHLGTAEVSCVLSLLEESEDQLTAARLAQLSLAEPVVAVHGQPFVLRAESPAATLGGGRILQPVSRRYRRRDIRALARLGRLRSPDRLERLRAALGILGLAPWTKLRLAALAGLALDDLDESVASLLASGDLIEISVGPRRTIRVLAEAAADLEERALRALNRLHAAHPRQSAVPRAQLTNALPDLANESLASTLLDRLESQGKLIGGPRTVALPGYEPKLSLAERKLKNEIAGAIRAGGMSPPDVAELAASAGQRAPIVNDLLALLRDEQLLVEIASNLFLDSETEGELRRRVRERLADGSAITMSELRDLLGTTRKYAVPIGEYLDRIGLTRREGDVRRLGSIVASTPA